MTALAVLAVAMLIGALWKPFYRRARSDWRMWRQRRRMQYVGALVHRVVVPAGPGGRPGEELLSPSLPAYVSRMFDGHEGRQDFAVMVGKRSILQAVCKGPADPGHQADVSAARAIGDLHGMAGRVVDWPISCTLLGEDAQRYVMRLNSGRVLTEWHLVHAGWRYAVGVVQHPIDNKDATLRLVEQIFESWRWAPVADTCR